MDTKRFVETVAKDWSTLDDVYEQCLVTRVVRLKDYRTRKLMETYIRLFLREAEDVHGLPIFVALEQPKPDGTTGLYFKRRDLCEDHETEVAKLCIKQILDEEETPGFCVIFGDGTTLYGHRTLRELVDPDLFEELREAISESASCRTR